MQTGMNWKKKKKVPQNSSAINQNLPHGNPKPLMRLVYSMQETEAWGGGPTRGRPASINRF